MILSLKKLHIKLINTMVLLLMLQGVSWTHMTLSVEYVIVTIANFNRKEQCHVHLLCLSTVF